MWVKSRGKMNKIKEKNLWQQYPGGKKKRKKREEYLMVFLRINFFSKCYQHFFSTIGFLLFTAVNEVLRSVWVSTWYIFGVWTTIHSRYHHKALLSDKWLCHSVNLIMLLQLHNHSRIKGQEQHLSKHHMDCSNSRQM